MEDGKKPYSESVFHSNTGCIGLSCRHTRSSSSTGLRGLRYTSLDADNVNFCSKCYHRHSSAQFSDHHFAKVVVPFPATLEESRHHYFEMRSHLESDENLSDPLTSLPEYASWWRPASPRRRRRISPFEKLG